MLKNCCIQVTVIYECVQFDADPRSGDLKLLLSHYRWFKIHSDTRLLNYLIKFE